MDNIEEMSSLDKLAQECAELKMKMSLYEDMYKDASERLFKAMKEAGESERETSLGKFKWIPKTSYSFSDTYNSKKEELDVLKQTEINDKIAVATDGGYYQFNKAK